MDEQTEVRTPERTVARVLDGRTLAFAESCTGGALSARIVSVPGSSRYFLGSIVAYSNELKMHALGVEESTLIRYGAVSEECALEMARGARKLTGADIAVSTTGIAGPDGGTPEKPVGLVYVALSATDSETCARNVWPQGRAECIERSVQEALRLLLNYIRPH